MDLDYSANYIVITGSNQRMFSGDLPASRPGAIGLSSVDSVGASGLPHASPPYAGRKDGTSNTIRVAKEWGPASPQLQWALMTREVLQSVVIHCCPGTRKGEFGPRGITLTNAVVSSIRPVPNSRPTRGATPPRPREEVVFSYRTSKMDLEPVLNNRSY